MPASIKHGTAVRGSQQAVTSIHFSYSTRLVAYKGIPSNYRRTGLELLWGKTITVKHRNQ